MRDQKSTPPARYTAPTAELTPRVVPSPALRLGVDAGRRRGATATALPIGGSTGVPTESQRREAVQRACQHVRSRRRRGRREAPSRRTRRRRALPLSTPSRFRSVAPRRRSSGTPRVSPGACVESNTTTAPRRWRRSRRFPDAAIRPGRTASSPRSRARSLARGRACSGSSEASRGASGRRLFTRHGAFSRGRGEGPTGAIRSPLATSRASGPPRSGGSTSAVMSAMTRSSSSVDAPTPSVVRGGERVC